MKKNLLLKIITCLLLPLLPCFLEAALSEGSSEELATFTASYEVRYSGIIKLAQDLEQKIATDISQNNRQRFHFDSLSRIMFAAMFYEDFTGKKPTKINQLSIIHEWEENVFEQSEKTYNDYANPQEKALNEWMLDNIKDLINKQRQQKNKKRKPKEQKEQYEEKKDIDYYKKVHNNLKKKAKKLLIQSKENDETQEQLAYRLLELMLYKDYLVIDENYSADFENLIENSFNGLESTRQAWKDLKKWLLKELSVDE